MLDYCRTKLATRGNKTENVIPLIWSCCLAAPTIVAYVFFLEWETYVLHIDKNLNAIALAFVSIEFLLSLLAVSVFWRAYHL